MADNYLERKFEEMEKMKKRHSGYGRYGRMRASSVRMAFIFVSFSLDR